ncbi:MAG: hypothetical protein AAB792_01745 [Patescibacteria group bacterium]
MTLKDYTIFTAIVRKYVGLLKLANEKWGEYCVFPSVTALQTQLWNVLSGFSCYALGPGESEQVVHLFWGKIGFDPKAESLRGTCISGRFVADQIVNNEEFFFAAVAELYKPLIEKTATVEKPEGGQDAAKL